MQWKRYYTETTDGTVDKVDAIRCLKNEIILSVDKERNKGTACESTIVNIKLILEDIRRTAEHASDIAEAAMNQTIDLRNDYI